MNEFLLPDDSLKNSLSAPIVQKDSTLRKQPGNFLLTAKPAGTSANIHRPDEIQLLPMIHPIESVRVELTIATSPQGLILPERRLEGRKADWVIGVLILVFALFTSARLYFGKYLLQLFSAAVNYSTAARLFRERSVSLSHAAFRLDVIFFLTSSLFIFQIFGKEINFLAEHSFLKYLLIFSGTLLYIFGKQFLYILQGTISETKPETYEVLYNMNLYNRILGLGLIPVTLILAFSRLANPQIVIGMGVAMAIVCYALLVFRGMKILVRKDFPLFYLILYICTLEILPLFFIYKLVLL